MRKEFMVERQGKQFVLYAGLLHLAHEKGLLSIETEVIQIPTEANQRVAICRAVVVLLQEGMEKTFTGIGDAASNNVAPAMQTCLLRMAETRAKARALRDAVDVGVTAFEELQEGESEDTGAPERGYRRASKTPGQPRSSAELPPKTAPPPLSPITTTQIEAIHSLCHSKGVEASAVSMEMFRLVTLENLTYAQAAEMIAALNKRTAAKR